MTYQEEPAPTGFTALRLEVAGLQGGHSGIEIDRGRGNALKLLARLLASAREQVDVRLVSLAGGSSYNAIPREAAAIVAVPETEVGSITKFVATFAATIEQELAATEPDLTITATPAELAGKVMTPDAQRRIVAALYGVPNGIIRMSDAVPGLVETSTNIGVVEAADGELAAGFRVRSAMDSQRDDVTAMIASVFGLAGAETIARGAYSGWAPDPASPLLTVMQSVYQDLYERKAEVIAIHAGLETGVIGAKHPGLDVISVGPTIQNVHSPDERLDIASVGKVYDLLVATLARIPPQAAGSS
jgi:dipeptidase D